MLVAAFSGGKDSTAMALRMAENGERGTLLYTPTGDELDDLAEHIERVRLMTGWELAVVPSKWTLESLIAHFGALPNNRQRWCTRMLKIEPAKAFLAACPGSTLCVGLRADEEEREGMWGDYATYRYPLREYGWGEAQVLGYLDARGVKVPDRTDCGVCYDQRLGEWFRLWKDHPERYARGEELEARTGHTFRSPSRDKWPASLKGMRELFEAGKTPRGVLNLPLLDDYELKARKRCRVCTL
jgi:hypothetical protein